MTLTLSRISRSQEPLLQNLIQLYTHDFSTFWATSSKGDLQPDGRFVPYPMDGYWTRPHWSASLILIDAALAGFAMVNDQSHSDEPVGRNMAEFFVLRKYRGRGIGQLAAELVFSQHPGSWEVAVARANLDAARFWRRIINNSDRARNVEESDVSNDHWNGPVIRFEWG